MTRNDFDEWKINKYFGADVKPCKGEARRALGNWLQMSVAPYKRNLIICIIILGALLLFSYKYDML